MNNLVGKVVKNHDGVEQLVLEVVEGIYCIRTKDRFGDFNTYTKEGYFSESNPNSSLSLVVDSEKKLVTFDGWEEDYITPYKASLKNATVELSTEITGLIETNGDISEILSKLKILKKLVEL